MPNTSRVASIVVAAGIAITVLWSAGAPQAWLRSTTVTPQPQAAPEAHPQPPSHRELDAQLSTGRRLLLVATAPGRNVHEGTAQLGTDGANPQTFAAGALLENGSTLKEIYTDHIVLERDGLSTELYVIGTVNPPSTGQSNDALAQVPDSPRLQLLANASPPTNTQIIRAAPRFENDLIVGFEIYPGTRAGEFARLGLRGGDLLVAIDGAPLTSLDALNAALKDLGEGRAMTATVTRAGSEISVPLDGGAASSARLAESSPDGAIQ